MNTTKMLYKNDTDLSNETSNEVARCINIEAFRWHRSQVILVEAQ